MGAEWSTRVVFNQHEPLLALAAPQRLLGLAQHREPVADLRDTQRGSARRASASSPGARGAPPAAAADLARSQAPTCLLYTSPSPRD